MKKLLGIVVLGLLWCNISLTDEKPGRFFEDQPDVNDDYQIHIIYLLAKNTRLGSKGASAMRVSLPIWIFLASSLTNPIQH